MVLAEYHQNTRLFCIFVDNGLLRKHEFEEVLEGYEGLGLNVKGVRSADRFYAALSGVSDPEGKRKAIGATFIDVFDHESGLLDGVKWLGQGDHLSRCHRKRVGHGRPKRHHQVPSQCGGLARLHEVASGGTAAHVVQG